MAVSYAFGLTACEYDVEGVAARQNRLAEGPRFDPALIGDLPLVTRRLGFHVDASVADQNQRPAVGAHGPASVARAGLG